MEFTAMELSFLDVLAYKAGCAYLSDLRYIDGIQRLKLLRALEKIPAEAVSLREWKDAILYLTGVERACGSAEQARENLINGLAAACK